MLKRLTTLFSVLIFAIALSQMAWAENLTLTPDSPGFWDNDVVGSTDYPAPAWGDSSWQSGGNGKTQIVITAEELFGRTDVTFGDIVEMGYWTNKDTSHVESAGDWYIQFYTPTFDGRPENAWYGTRVSAEPYFSANLDEEVGDWNYWSTNGSTNTLRFFDSRDNSYFGSYTDPLWEDFLLTDSGNGAYADQIIGLISIATGSDWASGFEGLVDGLSITLSDQSVNTVNFEAASAPVPEPSTFLLLFAGLGGLAFLRQRRRA